MRPHDRREKEREEVRRQCLDAARRLFIARGIDGVTFQAVGREIGYTGPAVHKIFGSKEALLIELCHSDFAALREVFARLDRVVDPVERLRKIGETYVEFAMRNPNHYRFMFMTPHPAEIVAKSPIDRQNPDQDAYAFVRKSVADAIAAGCFRDEADDADLVAQVLWSGVHGLVSLHLNKGDDPHLNFRPVKKTARFLSDVALRGLLKEGG
jgi:AcrR family transcriptional regulator